MQVLLPYGFTLFSNSSLTWQYFFHVLLPYGFTLFSNHTMNLETVLQFYYLMDLHYSQTCRHDGRPPSPFYYLMDLHYSQTEEVLVLALVNFTTLWIYTILKRNKMTPSCISNFTTLWIYTILKRTCKCQSQQPDFTTLWIYTILKQGEILVYCIIILLPYGFTLFSNRRWQPFRKTIILLPYGFTLFSNPSSTQRASFRFYYLMDLHYSQTLLYVFSLFLNFTTLWIYTILKLIE